MSCQHIRRACTFHPRQQNSETMHEWLINVSISCLAASTTENSKICMDFRRVAQHLYVMPLLINNADTRTMHIHTHTVVGQHGSRPTQLEVGPRVQRGAFTTRQDVCPTTISILAVAWRIFRATSFVRQHNIAFICYWHHRNRFFRWRETELHKTRNTIHKIFVKISFWSFRKLKSCLDFE